MKIKIIENFILKEDALTLMNEMIEPSEINPYPEYYSKRNGGTSFPYNNTVMSILKKYGKNSNLIQKQFFNIQDDVIITKSFGSLWYPGTFGGPHVDAVEKEPFIEYSSVIYLNDEYTGGEIYFPKQNFEIKAKKYSAIFFPGNDVQYMHGVKEILTGMRFTALFMQSTKKEFEDPDFYGC